MMKRMLSVLFALGFIVSCFMVFVEVDVVSAIDVHYELGFEATTVGSQLYVGYPVDNSILTTDQKADTANVFNVSSTFTRSGTRSFVKGSTGIYGWWNLTYPKTSYLTNFSYYFRCSTTETTDFIIYFQNRTTGHTIVQLLHDYGHNHYAYYDSIGGIHDVELQTRSAFHRQGFNILNELGDVRYYGDTSYVDGDSRNPMYISANERIDVILLGSGTCGATYNYFDDLNFTTSSSYSGGFGESETDNDIYVSFKDGTNDNVIITGIDTDFVGAVVQGTKEFFVSSDLWSGYYSFPFNYVISVNTISDSWVDGSYHYLNVSCRDGLTGDYLFDDVSYNFQWYSGRSYDIIFYEQGYGDYINEWTSSDSGLIFGIRTDKYVYDYGEQVRVQYKLPSYYDLMDSGIGVSGLWVAVKDIDALFWNLGSLSDWHSGSVSAYSIKDDSFMYGDWFDAGAFTTKDTEDGYDRLEVRIGKFGIFGILANSYAHVFIDVYDDETGFVPSGNITDITPDEPVIGQNVKFTFNANNNGRFKIIFLGSGNIIYNNTFLKPVGNGNISVNFADVGQYVIYEDVFADTSYQNVDYMSFYVNGSGSDFEDWGKNNEYLYVMDDYLVADHDTLTVFYKTLVNNTNIDFISPKGAKAPFSTSVDNLSGNSLSISLPYWVAIGEWNVTMNTSSGVIYDTFHIVAEENNYAEFEKQSYSLNESVSFYIRHNKRCRVVLVHDGNSYGTDLFFDNTTLPEGIYRIENTNVFTEGKWELQLWMTNNRIPIKLLSSDTALFMYYYPSNQDSGIVIDFGGWNWLIGFIIFGVVLCFGILISLRIKSDKASSMVVGVFGFSGLAISTVLNLFPLWLPFLIGLFIVAVLFLLIRKG